MRLSVHFAADKACAVHSTAEQRNLFAAGGLGGVVDLQGRDKTGLALQVERIRNQLDYTDIVDVIIDIQIGILYRMDMVRADSVAGQLGQRFKQISACGMQVILGRRESAWAQDAVGVRVERDPLHTGCRSDAAA